MRLKHLDFLRAVAVIMVVGFHAGDDAGRVWHTIGWTGVDLFFVLSGFLVSGLLFREYLRHGEIRPSRFLIRRGLKIYPAFYVFLALLLGHSWLRHHAIPPANILGEIFFAQSYGYLVWVHTWSLAVEEHFYIALAIAVWVLTRIEPKRAPAAIAGVSALVMLGVPVIRLLTITGVLAAVGQGQVQYMTHCRIDALAAGVMVSWLYHFRGDGLRARLRPFLPLLPPLSALLLCTLWLWRGVLRETLGFTAIYLGYVAVLLFALLVPWSEIRSPGFTRAPLLALTWVGQYSYSIYLWHLIWIQQQGKVFPGLPRGAAVVTVALAGSILIGCLMSMAVEYPVLRLRERFFPSRSGTLAVEPALAETVPASAMADVASPPILAQRS